jgi:hypothetical protein
MGQITAAAAVVVVVVVVGVWLFAAVWMWTAVPLLD